MSILIYIIFFLYIVTSGVWSVLASEMQSRLYPDSGDFKKYLVYVVNYFFFPICFIIATFMFVHNLGWAKKIKVLK